LKTNKNIIKIFNKYFFFFFFFFLNSKKIKMEINNNNNNNINVNVPETRVFSVKEIKERAYWKARTFWNDPQLYQLKVEIFFESFTLITNQIETIRGKMHKDFWQISPEERDQFTNLVTMLTDLVYNEMATEKKKVAPYGYYSYERIGDNPYARRTFIPNATYLKSFEVIGNVDCETTTPLPPPKKQKLDVEKKEHQQENNKAVVNLCQYDINAFVSSSEIVSSRKQEEDDDNLRIQSSDDERIKSSDDEFSSEH
jgi:hypothetical protein